MPSIVNLIKLILLFITLQTNHGASVKNAPKARYMDMGNGLIIPDAMDQMHETIASTGMIMGPGTGMMMGPGPGPMLSSGGMYSGYMAANVGRYDDMGIGYVDHSIIAHVATFSRIINTIGSLIFHSFGIIPASFQLGNSQPSFVQLLMIKKSGLEFQEQLYTLMTIITADLESINNFLSYIPGYLLLKTIISVPVIIFQKITDVLSNIVQLFGFY